MLDHNATVTPDRTISGSYDWLRLGQGATDRQCLLRPPAADGRIRRSIYTRGWAITNDWRISIARAIVGNRATIAINDRCTISYFNRRPSVRSIVVTVRTINREGRGRWYDQSLHHSTDRISNRGILHVADRTSTRGILGPSVGSIVAPDDRSYDQSWGATIDRTTNPSIVRPIVRSIVATYDRSSWYQTTDRRSIVASGDRSYDQS